MVEFEHVYVDTSVIGRRVLNQPGALEDVKWKLGISSELISVELLRTIDLLRHTRRPPDEELAQFREKAERNLARLQLLPLDSTVLSRAGVAWPTPLGTLDAIHLATALLWVETKDSPLVFLTHDRQLAVAARSCGLHVYPARHETV